MSKMKHLLKKLHIGGGLNEHQRLGETRPVISPNPTSNSTVSSSSGSSSVPASVSLGEMDRFGVAESVADRSPDDFNILEEEFQMQLALAISASDPAAREDPESAQIDAAKRMSLGCFPTVSDSHALVELLSLQYWSYNVVNYDEKVLDGFYDIHCTTGNSFSQGKMPLFVDLQATLVSSDVNYDVILVNRMFDLELQHLERQAYITFMDCRGSNERLVFNGLIQKIANIVVNKMGGPVDDADEMSKRWKARSYELRSSLKTNILPLGLLDFGLSRHRALLFKVLADRINLPCMLVKGSHYIGTDDGAVNLIKLDGESEYIIDLMGAPGTLIPSELASSQLQNSGLDAMRIKERPIMEPTEESLCNRNRVTEIGNLTSNEAASFGGVKSIKNCRDSVLQIQNEIDDGFGELSELQNNSESTSGVSGKRSSAQKKKVKNVSKYVISAAKNPEFAQKLHAVLLESGASPPPDLFADIDSQGPFETKELPIHSINGEDVDRCQSKSQDLSASNDQPVATNINELLDNISFERKPKRCAEALVEQQGESDLWNHNVSQCGTTSENRIPLGGGIYEQIHKDAIGIGNAGIIAKGTHQKYMDGPSMIANASSCQRHQQLAWGVNNKFIGGIEKLANQIEAGNASEKTKIMDASPIHVVCDDHAENVGPVLNEVAEWEIPWDNINIGERIGIGSYGEVYRADWNNSDVAVKKFLDQDLSGDALAQLRTEVEIMLRLRHPNVVLFMGAVTRPPHFSILTEFLPRGSLYRLLHRSNTQLDEKRRLRMALDVAKGMNYLHTSHPTIVHRDLKSPNLLVDKNWAVKVCDFGLSRIKLHTFLSSKSTAGTPEWMAPEVLRNEPANEKCDVYSFGVILWELATCSIPWKGLNPMQVVGAVGFQDRRLEIPDYVDPAVAQIMCDCWRKDTHLRPSFSQLMLRLRRLQRLGCPFLTAK